MPKQKLKTGAEFDRFSRWRHFLCFLRRPGVKKSISRQVNKRERKRAKAELRVGISGAVVRNCYGRPDFEHVIGKIRDYMGKCQETSAPSVELDEVLKD